MADAHALPSELNFLLTDGTLAQLHRDEADRLVARTFEPAGPKHQAMAVPAGALLKGFGPWPGWDANRVQATLTEPDEECGLYEPERLFVLREQYLFLEASPGAATRDYLSLGPIEKAWWTGTEHVIQARQRTGRH